MERWGLTMEGLDYGEGLIMEGFDYGEGLTM